MAILPQGQFDPAQHGEMRDFSPVPPGKYIAKVTSSEIADTKSGGQMLVLTSEIAAGKYIGKGYVARMNIVNSNPTAVKIANEELATISRACGLGVITDSDQLHNIAHVVTLKLTPASGNYGPKNEPTNYKSAQGLSTAPVNEEPDEATLAIINGTAPQKAAANPAAAAGGAPPVAPAGFSPPPIVPAAQGFATMAPPTVAVAPVESIPPETTVAPPVSAPPVSAPPAPPVSTPPPVSAPPVVEAASTGTAPPW